MSKQYKYIRLKDIENYKGWDLIEIIRAMDNEHYHMCVICFDDMPQEEKETYINTINRYKAEIERLEYTLLGVMHSVDKWLDGDELKQDEVNRAATMREKTLQIVEKLEEENEFLNSLDVNKIRAEAVKEFAERLKKRETTAISCKRFEGVISTDDIDNLVKEFTEANNEDQ